MRAQPLGAVLSISIDLPILAPHRGREKETLERLVALFAASGHAVTWCAHEPATDETIRQALTANGDHEAALRVDPAWCGEAAGRSRLAAEVVGRTARARRAGLSITTLGVSDALADLPADLLVKHGIAALLGDADENGNRTGAMGPVPLRYGLWRIAADCRVVGGSRIADWRTAFGIRRAVDRCIRHKTPLHLAIDAASIAANSSPDRLGGLPAIVRHIERRRSAGVLRVCTIADVIARLAAPEAPRAAGSILRAA